MARLMKDIPIMTRNQAKVNVNTMKMVNTMETSKKAKLKVLKMPSIPLTRNPPQIGRKDLLKGTRGRR